MIVVSAAQMTISSLGTILNHDSNAASLRPLANALPSLYVLLFFVRTEK